MAKGTNTTNGGSRCSRRSLSSEGEVVLLDRDYALHVHREVRNAGVRVLSRLDVREGDGDGLAGIHLHVAGKLAHLVRSHVRVELRLDVRGNRGGIESDVVRAAGNHGPLDAVA